MEFGDLLKFIENESERLIKYYPCDNMDKETYARAVKLVEEVGELFNEILKNSTLQRKEKQNVHENLSEEFADVIITTLLLAKRMDVDVKRALEKKVEKINKRYD